MALIQAEAKEICCAGSTGMVPLSRTVSSAAPWRRSFASGVSASCHHPQATRSALLHLALEQGAGRRGHEEAECAARHHRGPISRRDGVDERKLQMRNCVATDSIFLHHCTV